jgi:nucleoside-diphosphate-sugar epimerase
MALFLFTKNILEGKPIDVFNYGHHKRDFTYVGDIVNGVVAAMDHVALEMATHKFGCVIVQQDNGKVVGILTANDALRLLGETLQAHYKN